MRLRHHRNVFDTRHLAHSIPCRNAGVLQRTGAGMIWGRIRGRDDGSNVTTLHPERPQQVARHQITAPGKRDGPQNTQRRFSRVCANSFLSAQPAGKSAQIWCTYLSRRSATAAKRSSGADFLPVKPLPASKTAPKGAMQMLQSSIATESYCADAAFAYLEFKRNTMRLPDKGDLSGPEQKQGLLQCLMLETRQVK